MVSLNRLMVIGNMGTDPEMRYTPNGTPVTTFRLAVTRRYTDSAGERRDDTEWFTVVAWNSLGEQCNRWLSKGRRIFVDGRLKSNTWTGADGVTRFNNEIVASRVLFLDRAPGDSDGGPARETVPAISEVEMRAESSVVF
jgi:single-strand DNA-binding protein